MERCGDAENQDKRSASGSFAGSVLPFQGEYYKLKILYDEELRLPGIRLAEGEIILRTGRRDREAVAEILTAWYLKKAKEKIPERTAYYARLMKEHYKEIRIKDQRTRWGSCSSKKNLNFSWRLIMAPPEVLDYVIVHELCHLKFMDHSDNFWNHVEEVLPDYKVRQEWLKANGERLMAMFA